MILAMLIPIETNGEALQALGKPTLAMLGGFSVAVVYRILNRLVETVESLVRGDTKYMVNAQAQMAKARFSEESAQTRLKTTANLMTLQQQLNSGANIESLKKNLGSILEDMNPSTLIDDENAPGNAPAPQNGAAPPEPAPMVSSTETGLSVATDTAAEPTSLAQSALRTVETIRPETEPANSAISSALPAPEPVSAAPAPPAPSVEPAAALPDPAAPPAPEPASDGVAPALPLGNQPTRYALLGATSYAGMNLRQGVELTDEVRRAALDLQRHLRAIGYLRAGIDGAFGQGTEDALRALQHDLLYNDGSDEHGGEDAPVRMIDYNRGRITEVTGVADADTVACIRDILEDSNFVFLPMSADARAANARIRTQAAAMSSAQTPMPFLLAILEQESSFTHFREPRGKDEDNYIVVGCDRNDGEVPYRITSRGYGTGQYTLFHHPPRQEEVEQFMLDVSGNLQRAVDVLREKFDSFIVSSSPGLRRDDRIAEIGEGPLRPCKYEPGDPRYMKDCAACMQAAGFVTIESESTPFYEGTSGIFKSTQYHRHERLEEVPVRAAVGCDWPYAVRRYNGSGVNSYWYQAEMLLRMKEQDSS